MTSPSPYEADFPSLFVGWATNKVSAAEDQLATDTTLTEAAKQSLKVDISYLKAAIERIAGGDA